MSDRPLMSCFCAPTTQRDQLIAEAILNKLGRGNFHAYSAGSQAVAARLIRTPCKMAHVARRMTYRAFPLEIMERIYQARRAGFRFRIHGLR